VQGNYIGTNAEGTSALANGYGVGAQSSNNTIGGTVSGARNIISGNQYNVVISNGASGVQVQGNYIGTNAAGTTALANRFSGVEDQIGVADLEGSNNNTIGGTTTAARNIISGNKDVGVRIESGNSGVQVLGNFIGTNAAGSNALANRVGVDVKGSNNTIGGTTTGARNIISGNSADGMFINTSVSGVQVQGNFIGTNAAGTIALGNGSNGVEVLGAGNTIGGTVSGARNIISGNSNGVLIFGGVSGVQVQGNYIGTNAAGTHVLANSFGIYDVGSNNMIGGTTTAARNIISGNSKDGVRLEGGSGVQVQGNYIGTNAAGTSALGNGANGIEVLGANNTIGGTVAAARSIISGNSRDGVRIASGVSGVQVQGNFIGTNAAGTSALGNGVWGIEVDGSVNTIGGTTAAAGNVISGNNLAGGVRIASGVSGVQVQGNYIGTNAAGTSALANAVGVSDGGSNNTIGGTTSGARNVISGNSIEGVWIGFGASGVQVEGNYIGTDHTGTSALGNFNGVEVAGSHNSIGGNVISGNTKAGVQMDRSASGASVQGNDIGTDVTGAKAVTNGTYGIFVDGSNNTIGGTATGAGNVISGNHSDGVLIFSGVSGVQVLGNFIGTDQTGKKPLPNDLNGVEVQGTNNTIGGTATGAGNVISGNNRYGLVVSASGVTVQGNYIGVDVSGATAVANSIGIFVNANNNTIGGTATGAGNVVSGNSVDGIRLVNNVSDVVVQGNFIGTDPTGTKAVANNVGLEVASGSKDTIGGTTSGAVNVISGNTSDGVRIFSSASGVNILGNYIGTDHTSKNPLPNSGWGVGINGNNNTIGGSVAATGNNIGYNKTGGVLVSTGEGNTIRRNVISANGSTSTGPGITLSSGANKNLAAPVLTSATLSGNTLTVLGTFTAATANVSYELEFFANPSRNPEGKGLPRRADGKADEHGHAVVHRHLNGHGVGNGPAHHGHAD
jgi:titin